jgi:hypothetical protein
MGSKGRERAEWQMVTRRKAKAGGAKRTTTRVRPSIVEGGNGSQHAAPGFEAASIAARKRKAEDSANDKLTTMAATIEQLMAAQKEMAESQRTFLESDKVILDRNKDLMETIKTQQIYSEVTANRGTPVGFQSPQTRSVSAASSQTRKEMPQVQDDRAVSIDMGRSEGS